VTYTVGWDPDALDGATRYLDDPAGLTAVPDAADSLAEVPRPAGALAMGPPTGTGYTSGATGCTTTSTTTRNHHDHPRHLTNPPLGSRRYRSRESAPDIHSHPKLGRLLLGGNGDLTLRSESAAP
jgi:hypothetical protein